jgi:AcrR family transcriptional regulator
VSETNPLESVLRISKSDHTKQRCLNAAVGILSSSGLSNLKYESIAQEAGVTRPLVKKYFPDKTRLIMDAAAFVRKGYQEEIIAGMLERHGQPAEQLKLYIQKNLALPRENRAATGIWICSLHVSHLDKDSRAHNTVMTRMGFERILALLGACPFDPKPSGESLMSLARVLQAILSGAVLAMLTEDLPSSVQSYEQAVAEDCFRLLREQGLKGI